MDIQINYDYRKEDLEKLPLHELAQFVLAREDKPFNTEVSISFVTDEAIAELERALPPQGGPHRRALLRVRRRGRRPVGR